MLSVDWDRLGAGVPREAELGLEELPLVGLKSPHVPYSPVHPQPPAA